MLGAALLVSGYRHHLQPDGVSYLSIGGHYADLAFPEAINAYWSPFWSWLVAPLLAVGVDASLASKLLNTLIAVGGVLALRRAGRTVGLSPTAARVVEFAAVPALLVGAFAHVTPDLLVGVLALLTVDALARLDQRPRSGVLAGGLAGAAYLAKLIALPWAVVLVVAAAVVHVRDRSRLPAVGAAATTLALVVAGWAAVLGTVEPSPTIGTAARVNISYLDEGSYGSPTNWAGFLPPPHERATVQWEDPAASQRVLAERFEGRSDDQGRAPVGRTTVVDVLGTAVDNLPAMLRTATPWVVAIVAAGVGAFAITRRRRHTGPPGTPAPLPPTLWFVGGAAVWAGGALLTFVEDRYVLPALLLLLPVAGHARDFAAASHARRRRGRRGRRRTSGTRTVTTALVLGLVPWSVAALASEWNDGKVVHGVAVALEEATDLDGVDVGSLEQPGPSAGLCFRLGCRYHGTPSRFGDPQQELAASSVDVLLLYDDPPAWLLDDGATVSARATPTDGPEVVVMDVTELTSADGA